MGCNSSLCAAEADTNEPAVIRINKREEDNQDTIEQDKNKKGNKNKKETKNGEKDNIYLKMKTKQKMTDKEMGPMNTEDNKDALSNVLTEGVITCDGHRITTQKQQCNGITLMKGIEEFFEDLNENEIFQLVEEAIGEYIIDYDGEYIPGTITTKQAKAIAKILYEKLNRKNSDEDDKSGDIDLKRHPELKGLNIKIGVSEFTKDVIKDIMFKGKKVDNYQVDLTYANLTKNNEKFKALSIQFLP